jgi:hypothetical protein
MCLLCAEGGSDRTLAQRAHVLQLLALIEHPDALPANAVLRLGREIMTLIGPELGLRRCDRVMPP